MVELRVAGLLIFNDLSVLALSSRFDGRVSLVALGSGGQPFSTRSVESF